MHQSKLLELLRKFSPRQLSRFGDFVQSPYFNKNQDNVLFFNYLQKYAPSFDHKNLEKKIVMQKLRTDKPADEKSLAYLMSNLTKLAEEFLSMEQFRSGETGLPLALMEQLYGHGLRKHLKSVEDSLEKTLEAGSLRNAEFYRKMMLFRRLQYEQSDPHQRDFNENLQAAADALDRYFIVEKLRYACEMQNLSNMLNLRYRQPFVEQAAAWAAAPEFESEPAVQVYRQLFLLLSCEDETAHFMVLKKLLTAHGRLFEPHELKQLYTLLLNYCTRRINRFNDENSWHEYLEINKLLLKDGLLLENGELPPWRYTNLVAVGLRTGQANWTHDFIHDFRDKLAEEYRTNLFHYNLAQFHFHQKDFDSAQRELVHVEFNDVLLNVSARSLLIKIYFETDQTEPLLSYLEATRIFLLRNKLLDAQLKQQLKKFVEFCTKLVRAEGDPDRLLELLEALPPPREVMHRDWLEGKVRGRLR